jgi:hypothetical protein
LKSFPTIFFPVEFIDEMLLEILGARQVPKEEWGCQSSREAGEAEKYSNIPGSVIMISNSSSTKSS